MATYIKLLDKTRNNIYWVNLTQVQTIKETYNDVTDTKWLVFGFQNGHSLNIQMAQDNVLITSINDKVLVEDLFFKATKPKVKK